MSVSSRLKAVLQRLDEVYYQLQEKEGLLRNINLYTTDPELYQQIDAEATKLEGRLEELVWFKDLLQQ